MDGMMWSGYLNIHMWSSICLCYGTGTQYRHIEEIGFIPIGCSMLTCQEALIQGYLCHQIFVRHTQEHTGRV